MELCGSQQALHEECDIVEDTVMQDGCKLTRCIRCSLSTRIGMRTEFFENDRPMILGWIVTRVVRLRAVLVRVRFGSGTRLHLFLQREKLPSCFTVRRVVPGETKRVACRQKSEFGSLVKPTHVTDACTSGPSMYGVGTVLV